MPRTSMPGQQSQQAILMGSLLRCTHWQPVAQVWSCHGLFRKSGMP